jgi:hypothetical protein
MNSGKFNKSSEDAISIKRMNRIFYSAVIIGIIAILYFLWDK